MRPPGGDAWIDFPGPPGTIRTLSFLDVEQGSFDPAAVRGKVVVVGATAARPSDFHATPTSDGMPRAGGPGGRGRHRARRLPAATRPRWLGRRAAGHSLLGRVGPLVALRFGTWSR